MVPGQPAVRGLAGHRVAALPLPHDGHRHQVRHQVDVQRELDRLLAAAGDLHLLDQPVGHQRAAPVDGDGRVVQPAAEPAGDVGELLPVGAQHGGADPLEVAAVDGQHDGVEQTHVVDEPPGDTTGTHLAVGVGQQQGRSGHRDGEVVEGRHEVVGHGPTL